MARSKDVTGGPKAFAAAKAFAEEAMRGVATKAAARKYTPKLSGVRLGQQGNAIERATTEAPAMWAESNFAGATPDHFVAFFRNLYAATYEVQCLDLAGPKVFRARQLAASMLEDKFGRNPEAFADYLEWVFLRECDRTPEEVARWRVSWTTVLAPGRCLEDYQLSLKKKRRVG